MSHNNNHYIPDNDPCNCHPHRWKEVLKMWKTRWNLSCLASPSLLHFSVFRCLTLLHSIDNGFILCTFMINIIESSITLADAFRHYHMTWFCQIQTLLLIDFSLVCQRRGCWEHCFDNNFTFEIQWLFCASLLMLAINLLGLGHFIDFI